MSAKYDNLDRRMKIAAAHVDGRVNWPAVEAPPLLRRPIFYGDKKNPPGSPPHPGATRQRLTLELPVNEPASAPEYPPSFPSSNRNPR